MAKNGYSEEEIKKLKRASVQIIHCPYFIKLHPLSLHARHCHCYFRQFFPHSLQ